MSKQYMTRNSCLHKDSYSVVKIVLSTSMFQVLTESSRLDSCWHWFVEAMVEKFSPMLRNGMWKTTALLFFIWYVFNVLTFQLYCEQRRLTPPPLSLSRPFSLPNSFLFFSPSPSFSPSLFPSFSPSLPLPLPSLYSQFSPRDNTLCILTCTTVMSFPIMRE